MRHRDPELKSGKNWEGLIQTGFFSHLISDSRGDTCTAVSPGRTLRHCYRLDSSAVTEKNSAADPSQRAPNQPATVIDALIWPGASDSAPYTCRPYPPTVTYSCPYPLYRPGVRGREQILPPPTLPLDPADLRALLVHSPPRHMGTQCF
jgi:hypothetical protein